MAKEKVRSNVLHQELTVADALPLFEEKDAGVLLVVNSEEQPVGLLPVGRVLSHLARGGEMAAAIAELMEPGPTVVGRDQEPQDRNYLAENVPVAVVDDDGRLVEVLDSRRLLEQVVEENGRLKPLVDAELDLNAIMDSAEDLMCISDGGGSKLRISPSAKKLYGAAACDLVGKNVRDLEKNGVYFPSATRLALEKNERVTVSQVTKSGRKLMVTANPIVDQNGRVVRVVSISKDITDLHQLEEELENTRELMEKYEKELAELRQVNLDAYEIVASSKTMQSLLQLAAKVAGVDSTVFILGESGVGKEMVAKLIHGESQRSEGPFIKINCGAIPEPLLESELFGYEKGAFTGASKDGKPGLMEAAHGGTLFLDEIAELPLSLQVKLLRVLQEQQFVRVGGVKPVQVDLRIIAATNRDIEQMVNEGTFRQDLYYRLNVVPISVPPLRERLEDIPSLAHLFLQRYSRKYSRSRELTPEAMEILMNYAWPGNVRELENIVERLVVTTEGLRITTTELPEDLLRGERTAMRVVVHGILPLRLATEALEEQLVRKAMDRYQSTYKAARALGINQSTVVRKVQKYLGDDVG